MIETYFENEWQVVQQNPQYIKFKMPTVFWGSASIPGYNLLDYCNFRGGKPNIVKDMVLLGKDREY